MAHLVSTQTDSQEGVLAQSGCISECPHKETIVYYTLAEPITTEMAEWLGALGELYLQSETGLFKVVKLDHFYVFGLIGDHELRICMYYYDKISDRLKIDARLIEYFKMKAESDAISADALSFEFNPSGSLAKVAVPATATAAVEMRAAG